MCIRSFVRGRCSEGALFVGGVWGVLDFFVLGLLLGSVLVAYCWFFGFVETVFFRVVLFFSSEEMWYRFGDCYCGMVKG